MHLRNNFFPLPCQSKLWTPVKDASVEPLKEELSFNAEI